MELRKNRKAIPCYWETQPVGCLKEHCPFLHQHPRSTVEGSTKNTGKLHCSYLDLFVTSFFDQGKLVKTYFFSVFEQFQYLKNYKYVDNF